MISNELLKKKILDEAIHGRLVENDSSLEPIDVQSINNDIPFEVPNNWKWINFKSGFELKQGIQINIEFQSPVKNDIYPLQFLRIVDFTQNNKDIRYVSDKYILKETKASVGYQVMDKEIPFEIKNDKDIINIKVTNEKIKVKIPNTNISITRYDYILPQKKKLKHFK